MALPDVSSIEAVDQESVDELVGRQAEGKSLFNKLFGIFNEEAPVLLSQLKVALESKDEEEVYDVIHQMKGSAAAMGATRLYKVTASALEHCRDNQIFEVKNLVSAISQEVETYQAAIRVQLED